MAHRVLSVICITVAIVVTPLPIFLSFLAFHDSLRHFILELLLWIEDIIFFFRWRFVCVSLYILLLLKKCLSEKTSKCKGKEQLTADLLSVSQQKTIRTCLQFVISMGVLPSLLPGVGISLAARSTSSHKLKVEELVVLEVH
jgi:hypothetical protein